MADDDSEDKDKDENKDDVNADGENGEGEGDGEGEGGDEAKKASRKKKLIIIVAAVILVVILGGVAAFFTGMLGGGDEGDQELVQMDDSLPVYFDLPQILVNLNNPNKKVSFIKTTVTLQLESQSDVSVVQANLPRLIDNYNTFLREMRTADLYGSAGVYRLREEMLRRANKIVAPVKVKDVLFREILVQ